MRTRVIAAGLAFAVGIAMVLTTLSGESGACELAGDPSCAATARPSAQATPTVPSAPSAPASSLPIVTPGPTPTATGKPAPSATPPVYTFRDEFTGSTLKSAWGRHWPGFGSTNWLWSQVSLGNGVLTIKARKSGSGSKWVSGLIDTVGAFTQKYGVFSARMKFAQGNGLWPAFWLAQPQNKAEEEAEIDVMEVCANEAGLHDGNDVTLLHHYVHKPDGTHAFALGYRTADLSGAWHVYTADWRADHITFYLDGVETATFTSPTDVSGIKMALVLDLAVGGRFCNVADGSTPKSPTLMVDWIRVTK
jgi:beta-glucanase (GH16 family)